MPRKKKDSSDSVEDLYRGRYWYECYIKYPIFLLKANSFKSAVFKTFQLVRSLFARDVFSVVECRAVPPEELPPELNVKEEE